MAKRHQDRDQDQDQEDAEDSGSPKDKKRKIMEELAKSLPEAMSKNQKKKQLKLLYKERMKPEWKRIRKEKEKKKVAIKSRPKSVRKVSSMFGKDASNVTVVIDSGYDHLMSEKDIKMLVKQCQRCYAENRRAERPFQYHITSCRGKFKEVLENRVQGYENWEVHFHSEDYLTTFKKDSIVYLAAESPNILEDLDPSKVYVIGGLVDHNHHKGHCYSQAVENGVSHAQLPLDQYVSLNSRSVLTVNHVFEILIAFEESKSWDQAIHKIIPSRKLDSSKATCTT